MTSCRVTVAMGATAVDRGSLVLVIGRYERQLMLPRCRHPQCLGRIMSVRQAHPQWGRKKNGRPKPFPGFRRWLRKETKS